MVKLRSKLSAGLALAVVAGGAGLFWLTHRQTAPSYQTAEVSRGDIEVVISASGSIAPKEDVEVGAQVSGQLEEFYVEIGDKVEKGDLLAQIDATIFASEVDAQRAQLKELKASRDQQEATLELANAEAARAEMLYKADATSQADYQAAMAERKIAKAKLAQLEAQIERQSYSLKADEATLEFTKIYAPMAGTVVSRAVDKGQTLNANQTTPTILTIADLTLMTVEAEVSEADVMRVAAGQKARFTTLGGGEDEVWQTSVRQVLPTPEVVNDVVLYQVLLDVENDNERLKPDMTAQVFFVEGEAKDAVLVPVAALSDPPQRPERSPRREETGEETGANADASSPPPAPGGLMSARARSRGPEDARFAALRAARQNYPDADMKMALVLEDGEVRPRPVLIGLQNRTMAQVLFGLEPGETVVTGNASAAVRKAARQSDDRRGPPRGMMMPPPPR